eukprot:606272-Prymnesium_polylepis.1
MAVLPPRGARDIGPGPPGRITLTTTYPTRNPSHLPGPGSRPARARRRGPARDIRAAGWAAVGVAPRCHEAVVGDVVARERIARERMEKSKSHKTNIRHRTTHHTIRCSTAACGHGSLGSRECFFPYEGLQTSTRLITPAGSARI